MTAAGIVVAVMCALIVIAFIALVLLCVAIFMIAECLDRESWIRNDMGKGCSDDEE